MAEEKKEVRKCTQCGANLSKYLNLCEYCGTVFEDKKPNNVSETANKVVGEIVSEFKSLGDTLNDIFDIFT